MDLAYFEREAEALLTGLNRERYAHFAGLKPTLDLGPIYERHAQICSIETYGEMQDQALEPKYLRFLLDFAVMAILGNGVKQLDERLANGGAAAQLEWNAAQYSFRSAPIWLANEPDHDRRRELDELIRAEITRGDRVRAERLLRLRSLADELDYPDLTALWSELRGLDGDVGGLAESILSATADPYDQALRDQLVHHRLDPSDAREADLAWVFRSAEYDRLLPSHELVPALRATLEALGIRLEDQTNLRLDRDPRPLKLAEAFTVPISVPDEVAIVQAPVGGILDYSAILQQIGQAESYAHVDRTQAFPFRRLGDRAVNGGYGWLMRGLLVDPSWLRWRLQIDDPRDAVRLAAFHELHDVRRNAALLGYEQELYVADDTEPMGERYGDLLGDALRICVHPERYLEEPAGLASAQRLRAWAFGGQLRLFLRREFDEEWFRSARAGRFLVDRWREGQKYTAEELARFMGFGGLDPAAALDELRTTLAD